MPVHCCARPGYRLRWWLRGWGPGPGWCTTLFDVADDRSHVMIYPGATSVFATMLDPGGVRALIDAATERTGTTVVGRHPVHGRLRLVLRPAEGGQTWPQRPAETVYQGPMELVARVPGDQLTIRYERCRLVNLRTRLAEILGYLDA